MYNLIFAIAKNNVIGDTESKYGMPWHYSEDLKFYKKMTTGQKCVMGRTTYEAIGSALPNRQTYVLTHNPNYQLEDASVIHSLKELDPNQLWWICGGVSVFEQTIDDANAIYITRIDCEHEGDVVYENLDLTNWHLASKKQGDNPQLTFERWERNDNREN